MATTQELAAQEFLRRKALEELERRKTVFEKLRETRDMLEQANVEAEKAAKEPTKLELSRREGLFKSLPGGWNAGRPAPMNEEPVTLGEKLVNAYRAPVPQEEREVLAKGIIREEIDTIASALQSSAQRPHVAMRWTEEHEQLRGKFLAKTGRRLERGVVDMIGGAYHVADTLAKVASFGTAGDSLADNAKMYSDVLNTPEMQPVVENALDKYLGGAVEMSPFLASTMVPGFAVKLAGKIPTSIGPVLTGAIKALTPAANFLTTYGVEANHVYQLRKAAGDSEEEARVRGAITGIINGAIELRGGSGDKYFRRNAIKAATSKLGRFKYFSRKALRTALAEGLAEELPQEAVSMVLGKDTPRKADGTIDWGKSVDRMIDTAIMGTLIGGLVASPHVAMEAYSIPSLVRESTVPVSPTTVSIPGRTYAEARVRASSEVGGVNPWVKQKPTKTNKGRVLLVQFASDLLTEGTEDPRAKAYYDKLYARRSGYARLGDTWEVPKWMTEAANFVPDADVYFVRDLDEARRFLKSSGYDKIMFSALDINTPHIKQLSEGYKGKVVIGGYGANKAAFSGMENVQWYDSMEGMAKGEGYEYVPGVNLSHFEGSAVIPRLCLSEGCKHKCAFCVVKKGVTESSPELIRQQAEAIAQLDAKLVYLDDKTFGQAPNHKMLSELYWMIKERNPEFEGFIIQTTAAQFDRFSDEFLTDAHIKYVEIGVESYNDDILKELHKPHSTATIDLAVAKARRLKIALIPNVIIGLPQETPESYARTLAWLRANSDVISHINAYSLALYAGTEITQKTVGDTGVVPDQDINENAVAKSFHKNPEMHEAFARALYDLGNEALDQDAISQANLTADQAIAEQYGIEPGRVEILMKQAEDRYRELKLMDTKKRTKKEKDELAFLSRSRNDIQALLDDITGTSPVTTLKLKSDKVSMTRPKDRLLDMGHGMAQQLGLTEEERRDIMLDMAGKNSMKKMTPEEMEQYVQYLEAMLDERGEKYEPKPAAYYEMIDQMESRPRTEEIEPGKKLRDSLKAMRVGLTKVAWEFTRLDRLFEWLDGGSRDGWFKRTFYRPVVAANSARNTAIDADVYGFDEFVKSLGLNPGTMMSKATRINDRLELNAAERIGMFMLWMNDHGRKWLETMKYTEQDIADIYDFMGGDGSPEVKVAEYMFNYYEAFWPILQRVAISVGIDEKSLQQEFLYSPIMLKDKMPEDQPNLIDYFTNSTFAVPGTKPEQKFLEKRIGPKHGGKIETNAFVLFFNMVNRLNTFQHMAPTAYSLSKILNDLKFRESLDGATSGMGYDIVNRWLKHAVMGHGDKVNNIVLRSIIALRNSGVYYAIGYNVPSFLRQVVGTINTLSDNPQVLPHFMRTVVQSLTGGHSDIYKQVVDKSELIRHRSLEEVLRKSWSKRTIEQRYGKGAKLNEMSMKMLHWGDLRSVTLSWWSMYQQKKAEGAAEEDAVNYAEEWLAKTQEVSDAVYLPDIMRNGVIASLYKILAPFTNQINNQLNLYMYDNWQPIREHGTRGVPLTAYKFLMTWIIPALLFGMIGRGRLPEDPKEVAKDLAEYPIATLLFVGDAVMYAVTGESKRGDLYEMGFTNAGQAVRSMLKGDIRGMTKNAARSVGILGGAIHPAMRGAVTAQTIRSIESAYDTVFSEEKPPPYSLVIGEYAAKVNKKKETSRRIVR